MVSPVGLEPTTCGLEVRCSVQSENGMPQTNANSASAAAAAPAAVGSEVLAARPALP